MKQLLQSARTGEARVVEVPAPALRRGSLLVRVCASVVSAGTERAAVEFARKSLLGKARSRPDLVRQVMEKVRREGVAGALETVRARLDRPLELGYSCAGTVVAVAEGVEGFRVGDGVACGGAGYAVHAEVVCVPKNLAVVVPAGVGFEDAAFATVGAIALHGLRLAEVELGDTVAVIGLGLIGLLVVQLARAAGCRVMGVDPDPRRVELARALGAEVAVVVWGGRGSAGGAQGRESAGRLGGSAGMAVSAAGAAGGQGAQGAGVAEGSGAPGGGLGVGHGLARGGEGAGTGPAVGAHASDPRAVCAAWTGGRGVDAALVAAATASSEPLVLAGELCRDRGRVVVVGAVGMEVPRRIYYEKELVLRVSRSYGPGRYDPEYEEKGHGYPIGYVPWTETRNMEAFLSLVGEGKVRVAPLVTHRFPIDEADGAYRLITGETGEPFLGVVITYPQRVGGAVAAGAGEAGGAPAGEPALARRVDLGPRAGGEAGRREGRGGRPVRVGVLGAGNFATATLLPAMARAGGVEFVGVCTASGASGRYAAERFGFRYCTTDEGELLGDEGVDAVVIATRHALHGRQVVAALRAGKHVFCEKPLCLDEGELAEIVRVRAAGRVLMVGYNRRFAPMAVALKEFVAGLGEPLMMQYRVNAGYIPGVHWVQDPEQGGGRIVGECCHFMDLLAHLAGAPPVHVDARALPNGGRYRDDNVVITLEFADGSLGTVTYVANGDRAYSKERLEVFGGGAVAVLDDFRTLVLVRSGRRATERSWWRQDKGHRNEWRAFAAAVRAGGPPPIALEELVATSLASFRAVESLGSGERRAVDAAGFMVRAVGAGSGGSGETPAAGQR